MERQKCYKCGNVTLDAEVTKVSYEYNEDFVRRLEYLEITCHKCGCTSMDWIYKDFKYGE